MLRLRWMARVVALAAVGVSGCTGFSFRNQDGPSDLGLEAGRADADAAVLLPACSSTSLRGYQPLGTASQGSRVAALGWSGDGMAMVWEEVPSLGEGKLYWAKTGIEGKVVGAPKELGAGHNPILLAIEEGLTLLWLEKTELKLQRLDSQGNLQGKAVAVQTSAADSSFAAVWTGKEIGLVLSVGSPYEEVNFMRADNRGKVLRAPQPIPQQGNNHLMPTVAWTGSRYVLAWTDLRGPVPAVYAALLDQKGARIGNDIQVSEPGSRGSYPSVAAQLSGGALVCYEQKVTETNQEVYCSRLDPGGKVTRTTRLTLTAYNSQNPEVLTSGKVSWVVWDDSEDGQSTTIHWQFLDETGTPVLAQPRTNAQLNAWRPQPAAAPLVGGARLLYIVQYSQDANGTDWSAEAVTVNCF